MIRSGPNFLNIKMSTICQIALKLLGHLTTKIDGKL